MLHTGNGSMCGEKFNQEGERTEREEEKRCLRNHSDGLQTWASTAPTSDEECWWCPHLHGIVFVFFHHSSGVSVPTPELFHTCYGSVCDACSPHASMSNAPLLCYGFGLPLSHFGLARIDAPCYHMRPCHLPFFCSVFVVVPFCCLYWKCYCSPLLLQRCVDVLCWCSSCPVFAVRAVVSSCCCLLLSYVAISDVVIVVLSCGGHPRGWWWYFFAARVCLCVVTMSLVMLCVEVIS